jgi:SAM-dependent methyltransferase
VNSVLALVAKRLIPPDLQPRFIDFYAKYKYALINFHCPFCEKRYSHLLPAGYYLPALKDKKVVGAGYRLHAVCPGCGSSDRERLVYLYLTTKTDVFHKRIKLLHVAPEENLQHVFRKSPNIDYLSADLDPSKAMIRMDISDIHYEDSTFDVIICNHVLEHVPDDRRAMGEIYRVLKSGGWAILQVPISMVLDATFEDVTAQTPQERERLFGQEDHVRIYARDYRDRLEGVGFFVEVFDPLEEFGWVTAFRNALLRGERIYVGRKEDAEDT